MTAPNPRAIISGIFAIVAFASASARADYTIPSHLSDFESRVSLTTTGSSGDYGTSPSLTPWFGRLVARELSAMWDALRRPDRFTVVDRKRHVRR